MKLITKFISIIITLSVVMNVLVILPVSATEEETEELITSFSGVPLSVKAKLYNDDGLMFENCFVVRESTAYYAYFLILIQRLII